MSKYHVNNQGDPGKCRAVGGRCPFGSADEHHDSPEVARAAFEKSNEGKEIPPAAKKVSRRERKEQIADLENQYKKYDPKKYDGVRFSDAVWDHIRSEEKGLAYVKNNFPKLSKADTEDAVNMKVQDDRRFWENKGRTNAVSPFEKQVPIRLVPVGTEVLSDDGKVIGVVDQPSPRHDIGDFVGTVRMNDGSERDFEANRSINIGNIPSEPSTSTEGVWTRENDYAKTVSETRENFRRALKNGRALDNLEKML